MFFPDLGRASKPMQSPFENLGNALHRLANEATAGVASMSFQSGEVNRYAKNTGSRSLVEGPVLRRPGYLSGIRPADYVYKPIGAEHDFRVLKIWPSASPKAERVRCALVLARIEEMQGQYDTLSYTWGNQARDFPVLITDFEDDMKSQAAVSVTPHLYDALLKLRAARTPVYVWIDQLCIDQSSNEDKSSQVARMADIYQFSRRTVVWLGSCSALDQVFLQDLFLAFTSNEAQDAASASDSVGRLRGLLPVTSTGPSIKADQRQGALTRLLNRTWFTRAWIFQEVVLSREVEICIGDLSIPLDNLIRLADAVCAEEVKSGGYALSIMMSTAGYDALSLIKHKRGCGAPDCQLDHQLSRSLLALLMQTLHQFRATDPRDYIYAYLAFQDKKARQTIQPDYALAPGLVWTAAARVLIRQSRSLDIFAAARGTHVEVGDGGKGFGGGRPGSHELASWVPYWPEAYPYARPIYAPDYTTTFDACLGAKHEWIDGEADEELVVQGTELSKVVWQSPLNFAMRYHRSAGGTKAVLDMETQISSAERHFSVRSDGVPRQFHERYPDAKVAFLRTMLADGAFGHQQPMSDEYVRDLMRIIDNEAAIQENEEAAQQNPAVGGKEHEADYRRLEKLRNQALIVQQKRVFITASGHLALGSTAVGIGDSIWVLHGSKTPCVLRESNKGLGLPRFGLIGQCYVDGIMYGQAARDAPPDMISLV